MFCDFNSLSNKHFVFCMLQFIGSTASSIGLCMSSYGLAKYRNEEWVVENYIIVSCIATTIVCVSIKDSLIANPSVLRRSNFSEQNLNNIDV
jgi:hypothetical protein